MTYKTELYVVCHNRKASGLDFDVCHRSIYVDGRRIYADPVNSFKTFTEAQAVAKSRNELMGYKINWVGRTERK